MRCDGLPGPAVRAEQRLEPNRQVQVAGELQPVLQERLGPGERALVDGQPRGRVGPDGGVRRGRRALLDPAGVTAHVDGEHLPVDPKGPRGDQAALQPGTLTHDGDLRAGSGTPLLPHTHLRRLDGTLPMTLPLFVPLVALATSEHQLASTA